MRVEFPLTVVIIIIVVWTVGIIGPIGVGTTETDSMEPEISSGDLFFSISHQPTTNGDVIIYTPNSEQERIVHRVVGMTEDGYYTKGDANTQTDQAMGVSPVHPKQIDSKLVTVGNRPLTIPYLGGIVQYSSFPLIFSALIVITFAVILYMQDMMEWAMRNNANIKDEQTDIRITQSALLKLTSSIVIAGVFAIFFFIYATPSVAYDTITHPSNGIFSTQVMKVVTESGVIHQPHMKEITQPLATYTYSYPHILPKDFITNFQSPWMISALHTTITVVFMGFCLLLSGKWVQHKDNKHL